MHKIVTNGVDVSVNVNGSPVRTYTHEGKFFIESRLGTEYTIDIKNNTLGRVEVVCAVDGLSVITGRKASKKDSGYVVNGYDKITIKGFRKDMNEIGSFKFAKKEKSYAAGKGQAQNTGVIAIAVYAEAIKPIAPLVCINNIYHEIKQPSWFIHPVMTCNTANDGTPGVVGPSGHFKNNAGDVSSMYCSTSLNSSNETMRSCSFKATDADEIASVTKNTFEHGTTWGTRQTDRVVNVEFERGWELTDVEIFYAPRERLEDLGVRVIPEKQVSLPRGFPQDFASPPADWQG